MLCLAVLQVFALGLFLFNTRAIRYSQDVVWSKLVQTAGSVVMLWDGPRYREAMALQLVL